MIWIYKKDLENWQKLQNDLKSIRMTPNKKTENKLLTAVEWYTDELLGIKLEFAMGVISESEYHTKRHKAFEQAKQIEKEQSKQDYDAGLFDGTMDDVKDRLYKNAEQYYNETYDK